MVGSQACWLFLVLHWQCCKHERDCYSRAKERDRTGQNGARNEITRMRLVLKMSLIHCLWTVNGRWIVTRFLKNPVPFFLTGPEWPKNQSRSCLKHYVPTHLIAERVGRQWSLCLWWIALETHQLIVLLARRGGAVSNLILLLCI